MAMQGSVANTLAKLHIDHIYHPLLEELCSEDAEYLIDVVAEDLEGGQDANGSTISASVAKDLISKLGHLSKEEVAPCSPSKEILNTSATPDDGACRPKTPATPDGACVVSLLRASAANGSDAGLVRCALRGKLPQGAPRCKVLAVVLDRSGSMAGSMWTRVVEGVVSVVTDELLADANISIALVVYADKASEVPLPSSSSELRDLLLSRDFLPKGGTCFKSAFELTQHVLKRELDVCKERGFQAKDVDLATLVFTDGEDTSVKMLGDAAPADADDEQQAADDGVQQFVAFTGSDERTARYYIEGSARRGTGIDDAIADFFEQGGALAPRGWQPSGVARRPARARVAMERPTLVDKESSLAAARSAGDAFRDRLSRTGCATYLCVAAFGADHNPEQCQYLSDRYYYINRGEVLADVLAGSLGALLNSAGQCALRVRLPSGITLEEPILESLPLDASGHLDHHIWLRADGIFETAKEGEHQIDVEVDVAGTLLLQGSGSIMRTQTSDPGSFEGHLFLIDLVALQLRRVARELCGRRPSAQELTSLRMRLTDAKDILKPTKEAASVAVGHLRGRAALRQRLAEVEAARERLSYALGQFDEQDTNDDRQIGSVAIDAILRDAGQHVPQGPVTADLARHALAVANLPAPEPLSKYGKEHTTDGYSCCDASELASQGDALFFQLGSLRFAASGEIAAAEDGYGLVGGEAFVLLSRNGKQAVKTMDLEAGSFTHLGIPLYVTPGHFLRVREFMPSVLRRLNLHGVYEQGVSERQLLNLLGRSLAAGPSKSEAHLQALLHKVRSVRAILASIMVAPPPGIASDAESSLLDVVLAEATCFLEDPSARMECKDLLAVAAAGLLVESWGEEKMRHFGKVLVEEALRRRVAHGLSGSGEAQRLCFAWGLLGPESEDGTWLDKDLPCPNAGDLSLEDRSFNPFTAPEELEALDSTSPDRAAPRPAGAAALLSMLSGRRVDTGLLPSTWATVRQQLLAWGRTVDVFSGVEKICRTLDLHMIEDDPSHLKDVQDMVASLQVPTSWTRPCLRQAFDDPATIVRIATTACLPAIPNGHSLRHVVAGALKNIVECRKGLVFKYPIVGADFPDLEGHSAESVSQIWGAPAHPVDAALHHKAMLRVWRRTMKTRISMTMKEALADKEYRKKGGKFKFPSPLDTFIRGLHRRTADLHSDWTDRLQRSTSGDAAREEAVAEMLLRLRWDDSDDKARAKLSQIVARIWDGLEGVDLTGKPPLSSALWLYDVGEGCVGSGGKQQIDEEQKTGRAKDLSQVAFLPPSRCAEETASKDELKQESIHIAEAGVDTVGTEVETKEGCAEEADSKAELEEGDTVGAKVETTEECTEEVASKIELEQEPTYAAEEEVDTVGAEVEPIPVSAPAPAAVVVKGKGKGKGTGKGMGKGFTRDGHINFRAVVVGADNARAAMDAGLQATFDGLNADLRRRMDTFAADRVAGRRVKLPWQLKAKQRKALHLWAEMNGLEHQSFGYRGKRRLHLIVPGVDAGEHGGEEDWEDEAGSGDEAGGEDGW